MIWTMPRPVLQAVAGLLAAGAAASFAMGIINAPDRGGRLPGERPAARGSAPAMAINAAEATPLSQERIEAPPKPPPKATNTDEGDDEDTSDQATNTTPAAKATNATPPVIVTPQPPPPETTTPAPDDEPPH
jgi:hypothetical protein